jgi:hypothetical protein
MPIRFSYRFFVKVFAELINNCNFTLHIGAVLLNERKLYMPTQGIGELCHPIYKKGSVCRPVAPANFL